MPENKPTFVRRTHANRAEDSICLRCFRTVRGDQVEGEPDLERAELMHVCSIADLSRVLQMQGRA